MAGFWREHSAAFFGAVVLHLLLAAALVFTVRWSPQAVLVQGLVLPIDATIVDARALRAAQAEQRAVAAARVAERQAAAQAKERQADARHAAEVVQARHEEAAVQAAARATADAERKASAAAEADKKRSEDNARKSADAAARAERETELRRQLAAEERASLLQASPAGQSYVASLQNSITRAWLKPVSARPGVVCKIEVTQVRGGEVIKAKVTDCNGDAAVRQSIENAVYRASPLPEPTNPALFQRTITLVFKPNE
jgi:colicin import membrane protein